MVAIHSKTNPLSFELMPPIIPIIYRTMTKTTLKTMVLNLTIQKFSFECMPPIIPIIYRAKTKTMVMNLTITQVFL